MTQKNLSDDPAATSERAETTEGPALPAWKAFVVQFSHKAGGQDAVFAGRVEHLSSGRRARFGSDDELLTILRGWLDDIEEPDPHKEQRMHPTGETR